MNEPKTTAPNLASSCIQIDFSAGTWTGRKLDRKASDEVEIQNNAHPNMANVHKKLLGDCQELIAIRKFVGNVRNSHYRMTLPWSDMGLRIIPTTKYFDYHKQMTEYQNEFYTMLDKFLGVYDWSVIQADTLRGKFNWRLSYIPMPDAGDFRVDIGNEQADAIREQCAEYYSTMFHQAIQEIAEPLKNMSERLDYSNGEDKKVFRDTLVSNVLTAIDLLGVTSDPKFVKIKQELDHAFTGITPDALREDPYLRRTTKQAVDNAIASLDF